MAPRPLFVWHWVDNCWAKKCLNFLPFNWKLHAFWCSFEHLFIYQSSPLLSSPLLSSSTVQRSMNLKEIDKENDVTKTNKKDQELMKLKLKISRFLSKTAQIFVISPLILMIIRHFVSFLLIEWTNLFKQVAFDGL